MRVWIWQSLALTTGLALVTTAQERIVTQTDCSCSANPGERLKRESHARREAFSRAAQGNQFVSRASVESKVGSSRTGCAVAATEIPIRNLVDEEIFPRLTQENIPSAPLAGDEVFIRRVMLDLNGRSPSPKEVRDFVANDNPNKRDELINALLFTPEFVNKWTMWLGDLMQNAQAAQNINQNQEGRNRMHEWMVASIDSQKSLRDIVIEALSAPVTTLIAMSVKSTLSCGASRPWARSRITTMARWSRPRPPSWDSRTMIACSVITAHRACVRSVRGAARSSAPTLRRWLHSSRASIGLPATTRTIRSTPAAW